MRAGTSWLHRQTAAHPQVWTPRRKELHFFDRLLPETALRWAWVERLARWQYQRIFWRGALAGKVKGETTPAYAILESERIALIHRWMPGLRLVYILRDPVERAWSHARKDFLQFQGKTLDEVPKDELVAFFRSEGVVRRGDYAGCLERWLRFFPMEQLLVLFYEDIYSRPGGLLRELYAFIGVDPEFVPPGEVLTRRVNSRPPQPMPSEVRALLEEHLYPQNRRLEELLGRPLPWATG